MAQDFRIELGVVTNLKPAEKQVQEFIRKQGNKEFTLTPKISTKGINEFREQFRGIQTEVKLAQAELDKFTQYNEKIATSKINDSLRDMAKVLGNIKAPVKETSTSFDKWVDSQGKLITQTRKFDNELGTVITRVEQYKNELGQTVTETTTFNDSWEKLAHNMDVVDDRVARAAEEEKKLAEAERLAAKEAEQNSASVNKMGETVQNTSHSVSTLGEKIITAAGKVALFKVSTTMVMAFYNAIEDAKDRVVEYDKSLTELKKVWDDAYGSLDSLSKKLSDIGKDTANTLTNMTDIATGIVKAGYSSEEDIAIMSEYVAKLQNTADEELTAAEATSILVSQLKAYHLEAQDASKVTDILNAVSAQQAVSSGDLSKALTVGSAAMATYGNTIEQTTALITAGTTVMQNRSQQVARGLNMIASKVAANEELLNSYGVALYDASGQLRSTYDVLVDLSDAWDEMSTAEQLSVGKTLAGVNQYRVFASVMGQMTIAQQAYQQALESTGATEKQNAVYMQSLQA